jgi:hypothetical protein
MQSTAHPKPEPRYLSSIFNQELWCLGKDVLHPAGNQLIAHGCTIHKKDTCRRYEATLDDEIKLCVFPWGVIVLNPQTSLGLFIERFGFNPTGILSHAGDGGIFGKRDFSEVQIPLHCSKSYLKAIARWFFDYESKFSHVSAIDWRIKCIDEWKCGKMKHSHQDMVKMWWLLSR